MKNFKSIGIFIFLAVCSCFPVGCTTVPAIATLEKRSLSQEYTEGVLQSDPSLSALEIRTLEMANPESIDFNTLNQWVQYYKSNLSDCLKAAQFLPPLERQEACQSQAQQSINGILGLPETDFSNTITTLNLLNGKPSPQALSVNEFVGQLSNANCLELIQKENFPIALSAEAANYFSKEGSEALSAYIQSQQGQALIQIAKRAVLEQAGLKGCINLPDRTIKVSRTVELPCGAFKKEVSMAKYELTKEKGYFKISSTIGYRYEGNNTQGFQDRLKKATLEMRQMYARAGIFLDVRFKPFIEGLAYDRVIIFRDYSPRNFVVSRAEIDKNPGVISVFQTRMGQNESQVADLPYYNFANILAHEVSHVFGAQDRYFSQDCPDRVLGSQKTPEGRRGIMSGSFVEPMNNFGLVKEDVEGLLSPFCKGR